MIIPEPFGGTLESRQYYNSYGGCPDGSYVRNGRCQGRWNQYGRWVLAAVVIIFFIFILFFYTCLNNRRRRRRGVQPRYGTGWMTPGVGAGPQQQQQPQYGTGWFGQHKGAAQAHPQQPPPPQYSPADPVASQHTGQTFNTNEGYYGHHNNDIPLQQPTNSYHPRGSENVYQPPPGPPPAKA